MNRQPSRYSSSLLALAFLSAAAVACSAEAPSSDETQLGSDQSDIRAGKKPGKGGGVAPAPNSCAAAGGACVGLSPSSCKNGHWADATTASCGSGLGVGCCVPDAPKPPPPPPPPATTCKDLGGSCVAIYPGACPSGQWGDANTCGGGLGVGCCLDPSTTCPTLSPPSPNFCPNGTTKPRIDADGCTRGYDCIPNPANACEAAGGQCVGLSPSSCANGQWADATTHSCGGGIGVGCCIP